MVSGLSLPALFPFFLTEKPPATGILSFPPFSSRYCPGLPRTVRNILSWDSGRQGSEGSGACWKGIPRPGYNPTHCDRR